MKKNDLGLATLARCVPAKDKSAADEGIDDGANVGVVLTAKIDGRITRGEAFEATPTASLLSEAVVAELARRLGVKLERFKKELRAIAFECLIEGKDISEALIDEHVEILQVMRDIKQEVILQLPKRPQRGAIKVVASIDLCDVKIK